MPDVIPPTKPHRTVRVRVEQTEPGIYAVTEIHTGKAVAGEFESFTEAWHWIAAHSVKARHG